ncbi:LysR substrate-binding domain-containing protein [Roseibium sp.]|uniref:LysR substrate-binding domain-containing protein n=1 Tax=Roseibium sp. TaxID=1936156 RepID=UPI003A96D695
MNLLRGSLPPISSLLPFEAAARHESFTRAAEELGLTQAAVSKQIRLLEKDLGITLFERRNRGVFLTEEGRRFGQTVGTSLSDIAAETGRIRGVAASNEVVLVCQLCEAFYWLTPRLARFHHLHPEIEVNLASSLVPLATFERPFDLAIQTTGRQQGSYPLLFTASDEIFPVCSPDYITETLRPLPAERLPDYRLLSHRAVPKNWLEWEDWFQATGTITETRPKTRNFDSYPVVLQAAASGQGIALGWRRTVEFMLADNTLVRPCEEYVPRPTEISVFRSTQPSSRRPEVTALLEWLRDELRD